jgi:DNA (cytosine-5)-methyltransferase 1
MARGLESSGFEHRAFIEFNKDACQSLRENYTSEIVYEIDIRKVEFNEFYAVDLIAGGPPCQPFSLGGKHLGKNDNRDMFPYAIKAIETLSPKAFIFENVKGLLRESFSDYFEYIIRRLKQPSHDAKPFKSWTKHLDSLRQDQNLSNSNLEYDVNYSLVNAADYGVPQTRERVVIIGTRKDLNINWKFPKPTHNRDSLSWKKYVTHEYWDRHKVKKSEWDVRPSELKTIKDDLMHKFGLFAPTRSPWLTVRDAISDLPNPQSNHGIYDHTYKDGARSYYGHSGSDYDLPSKTIKAGGHGVPGGENMIRFRNNKIRYFTILEAKRIQTFPDDYVISGTWGEAMRQIGNAVPVRLAHVFGSELFGLLRASSNSFLKVVPQHRNRVAV